MTDDQLRRRRAAAQLLHRPAQASADEIVRHLLAVQAQDLAAGRRALRARSAGLMAADVHAALSDDRALVVAWLCRGTLHLVCADDYPWLLALTAPARLASNRRRLHQEGVVPNDAERAVAIIERALHDEGPLGRADLAERIAAAGGIRTEGQAMPHLLMLAALRGIAVLGPLRGGEHAYVHARAWLGPPPPAAPREQALAELARRYLAAHGPASEADLAAWAGLPLRDARAGLAAIAGELAQPADGLVDLARRPRTPRRVPPRLLPAYDPYLLGWRDRSFAVAAEHARAVHPGGGMLRAVATSDGLAVGTWTARRRGARLAVAIEPFAALPEDVDAALQREAADLARFEGAAT